MLQRNQRQTRTLPHILLASLLVLAAGCSAPRVGASASTARSVRLLGGWGHQEEFRAVTREAGFHFLRPVRVDWRSGAIVATGGGVIGDPRGWLGLGAREQLPAAAIEPRGVALVADGSVWIADGFGPRLLHVGRRGAVLEAPREIPVPTALARYARGAAELRGELHEGLHRQDEAGRRAGANVGPSPLAGLASTPGGWLGYVAMAGPLLDDPERLRAPLIELDLQSGAATGRAWWYRLERPEHRLAAVTAFGRKTLVAAEVGPGFAKLYELRLDRADGGWLVKRAVGDVDGLRIDGLLVLGPQRIGVAELAPGAPARVTAVELRSALE